MKPIANEIFMASDGQDLSTPELLQGIAGTIDCFFNIIPMPARILEIIANAFGKQFLTQRLLGSFVICQRRQKREKLQWTPQ